MEKYEISVVLATFNGGKYIERQLDSIINQEVQPTEIIIIDDCSTDSTLDILQCYDFKNIKKIQIIKNTNNLGPIANFKKGISLTNESFIALCDQDDIWLPNKLRLSLENILQLDPNKPCVVYSDLTLIDSNDKILSPSLHKQWKVNPKYYDLLFISFANIVTGCTVLFNRKMKSEIEHMPINIVMHDYWIGLIGYSFGDIKYIPESTILYRSHNESVTSKDKTSFLKDLKNSKINITKQINQIQIFQNLYQDRLTDVNKKTFNKFFRIVKLPYIFQRLYIKLRKINFNHGY